MADKRKNLVAIGTILGVVGALALLWLSAEKIHDPYGPSKIRVSHDDKIWLLSHGKLHRFNPGGDRISSVDLSHWRRSRIQSDFYPLRDGDVLLAESDTHELYRCKPGGNCSPLLNTARKEGIKTVNAMMLAVDEQKHRIYLADNAGHRLLLLDFAGNVLANSQDTDIRVWYPNHIELSPEGKLLVTDTNHHKILRLSVEGDVFANDGWALSTRKENMSRHGRKWPMSFAALPNGQWWVAIAMEGMRQADVVTFDDQSQALHRLDLGAKADPVSFAISGDRVLIADTENFRIRQARFDGTVSQDFGSPDFRKEMRSLARNAERWRLARVASQIAIVAFPLLGILVLWRIGEPATSDIKPLEFGTPSITLKPGETIWAMPTAFYINLQRWAWAVGGITLLLLAIVMALLVTALFHSKDAPFAIKVALLPIPALPLAGMAWSFYLTRRRIRSRIGTDGQSLLYDHGSGAPRAYSLTAVFCDGFSLLAGRDLIPLKAGNRPYFDAGVVEQAILSRLPPEARLSRIGLYIAAMRMGNPVTWFFTLLAFAVFATLLAKLLPPGQIRLLLMQLIS